MKRNRIWQTFSSLRTGIVLLILVVVAAATGTLVLQRPITEPERLQQAYAPETLRLLDAVGLTDVYHAWWFAGLLALLCLNIVFASLERLPVAWRRFARPYSQPGPHFLAGLALQKEIVVRGQESGMEAAERAFHRMRLRPQRVARVPHDSAESRTSPADASLYAERHRFSRLAPYLVHASLLLIFGGGIVDALWGYRGYLSLTLREQTNQIELRDGKRKTLPFTIRCDGAGQENYPDGTPRRWWSKLAVIENGREVMHKEVEVNEPLVHRGLRFFQSGYGSTGQIGSIRLLATAKADPANTREVALRPDKTLPLDADTSLRLAAFVPDFVIQGNQITSRSDQPNNPAIQLLVESKKSPGQPIKLWLFPRYPSFSHAAAAPYTFQVRDLQMGYFTGLQVSHEPGQWAVWLGVLLMGAGLTMAFYFVHVRYWAVPVSDDRGNHVLWVGAAANKNREEFEERFRKLVEEIENNLGRNGRKPADKAAARLPKANVAAARFISPVNP